MIGPYEALELVVRTASRLAPRCVALAEACGLVLAGDVLARCDCPPFERAMMDGFAVRLADAGRSVPVAGEIPAGSTWPAELAAGECLEIMTGAPCPPGTEAVVPVEQIQRHGGRIVLPPAIHPGQHIAPRASDCRAGERLLAAGQTVSPLAVGAMALAGVAAAPVVPRPTLGIITTGGELAPAGHTAGPGQVYDGNGPMLAAMARGMHLADPPQRHAADQLPLIVEALAGMADLDIICLSGGVSVGRYDLVPQALVEYGGEAVFHGVRQKPAKPLLFARKGRQLLVGLPGNPLACHLGFERYVSAAIRKMSGRPAPAPQFQGELQQAIQPKKDRTHFVPARAEWSPGPATPWRLTLLPGNSSADLLAGCGANCYVELPPGADTAQAGRLCTFSWFEGGGAVAGPLFDPRGVGAISPAVALRDPGSADP